MEKLILNPLKEGENIGFSFGAYSSNFDNLNNIFLENTSANYRFQIFIYYT